MLPSEQQLSRLAELLTMNECRKLMTYFGLLRDWEDIEYSYTTMPLISKIMTLHSWQTRKIKGKPSKTFSNLLDALKEVGNANHLLCKVRHIF